MLPGYALLRARLEAVIDTQAAQGRRVEALREELPTLPDSYDALDAFARRVETAPLREDWPYDEPNDLPAIWEACDPDRPSDPVAPLDPDDAADRAEAAFLAAAAGCILGKPLEVNPTLDEIRTAARAVGEWSDEAGLQDYVSVELLEALGRRHRSWGETCRGRIRYVAPDDDMNYDVLGLMLLEEYGVGFTKEDLMQTWLHNLPPRWTFGPERTLLIEAAMHSLEPTPDEPPFERWASHWNPGSELCGAAIRVDAYGYACAGRPALAAELAWRDASWTHRRTGIYGSMFVAAAIAAAFVAESPLEIVETALAFVPQRSRFYERTADCLAKVREASDWLDGYARIHADYGQFGHCRLYQEVGTLINTLRFAEDVGHGIGIQVAQGNDTDCFGEIAGSLLGAYFGPGSLDPRWLAPFNDEIRTAVATFYERSLSAVAARMGALPGIVAAALDAER